jgi:tape measure domain-containing protein
MASITAELALEISKFQSALKQAQNSLKGFRGQAQQQGAGLGQTLFAGVGKAAAGVGAMVAGALAAAGLGKVMSGAIERAVSDEQLQVSFDVLVGDSTKAKETIESLRRLGAETPFEFPELAEAGKKLIAFGEGADSVTETLRRIGDVSSGIQAPIGEIAEIYGKARVQGRLFAEDINQLTGRGIPIIQEFARQLGVTDAEVKQMASDGRIGFANLEQAFISLTSEGGKFGGMMALQSRTVGGLWSTLKDNVGEVLLSFGQPINDALRPMLDAAIEKVGLLKEAAARVGAAVSAGMKAVVAIFQEFTGAEVGKLALDSLTLAFKEAVNLLYKSLVGSFFAAVQMLVEQVKSVILLFSILTTAEFWKGLGNVLLGLARSFGAAMLEFIAQAVENLKTIPGVSALLGDADQFFRDVAQEARSQAESNYAAGSDALAPVVDRVQQRIAETFENVAGAFQDNFSRAATIFDTSEELGRLEDAARRVRERVQSSQVQAAAKPKAAAVPGVGGPVNAEAGKTRVAPGLFASAVNLIMGRSANELILDESKKQTAKLDSIDRKLGEMNRNLEKPPPQRAVVAAPVMPFDTVARFA